MASLLSQRKHTTLYIDRDYGPVPVVLKVLNDEYPGPRQLARFTNEHAMSQVVTSPAIRPCVAQTHHKGRHALVLEYIEGEELSTLRVDDSEGLLVFLQVACELVEALAELHAVRMIHRDLKPDNILISPRTKPGPGEAPWKVTLIDLGLATQFDLKSEHFANPHQLEGTLDFISPEQSGRMNRTVDYRSDYYSLGATLYTLLAGHPPFVSDDPMELVYSHLVRTPAPLHLENPVVPETVAAVVAKLLDKSPEARYQSSAGLLADLRRCIESLEGEGQIEPFSLGLLDHSGRFVLVEKLYGREAALGVLLDAFADVGTPGGRLVCVTGPSGTGKSALVSALFQAIATRKGQFVRGKFEQLQRNIPFLAFGQALSDLIHSLMTEDASQFAVWREALEARLGGLARALLPVVPNIELLMGPQPPVPPLAGAAGQHRLFYLVRQLLQVLAPPTRPLVLFLDDLQWADLASLELLSSLLTDPERGQLLLLGAYRDDEVDASHPLSQALEELAQQSVDVQVLALSSLGEDDVVAMLEDTIHTSAEEIRPLAALVHKKTSGNAFFVHSFLALLAARELLHYERDTHSWSWDVAQIEALQVTDNVADFMVDKIKELPEALQEIMQLAACVGNRFELQALSLLCDVPAASLAETLSPALSAGLVRPLDDGHRVADPASLELSLSPAYSFAHDRVQEAAVSLLSPEAQGATHWKIGQQLLANATSNEVGEDELPAEVLFGILHHLNQAPANAAAASVGERLVLGRLNLRAGRLATQAGAYAEAMRCCELGLDLCCGDAMAEAWAAEYDLVLGLHLVLAEAAGLAMHFARVREVGQVVLTHAHTGFDKARAYDALAMVDMAREDLGGAISLGLKALEELGVHFPAKPVVPHVILSLLRTQRVLKGRVEELADLPPLEDPALLAALSLIERLMPAAFRSGSTYFPLFVFEVVRLSALHGNSRHAVFGYASFAIAQCAVLKKYEVGYRFATLACRLGEIYPDIGHLFIFNTFVRHWREPMAEIPAHMAREYRVSLEAGNLYQATWLAAYRIFFMFLNGEELPLVESECERFTEALKWDEGTASVRLMLTQCIANLTQPCEVPHKLEGEHYDEAYVRRRYDKQNDATEIGQFHILNMLLAVLFGVPETGLSHAEEVVAYVDGLNPMPFFPLMHLLCAMTHLGAYRTQPGWRRMRRAKHHVKEIVRLAKEGTNYTHFAALARAELYWAKGKPMEAAAHYAEGLKLASLHKAPLYQRGLLFQRAALFHESQGHEELAQAFWRHALQCFRQWGASTLVAHWQQEHPQSLPIASTGALRHTTPSHQSTTNTSSTNLDLQSLWKASATLSAEIVKDRLLERVMQIMVENAGAERGVLLLPDQGALRVAAVYDEHEAQVVVYDDVSPGDADARWELVCLPVVQFVTRTKQPLVLADAQTDKRFAHLPQIVQAQVRSVLCAPIAHQGRQSAVVYLENNVVAGAFTPQRLEIVTLLSAQAGTALENATLYGALEEKVTERTRELKEAMTQLVQSEKMASLGTLVAGVAHELNNPTNFAYNGAQNLRRRVDKLEVMLLGDEPDPESKDMLQELLQPLYGNIASIEEGAKRIQEIVLGLRTFSRLDESNYKRVSMAESIEATLMLVEANYREQIEFSRALAETPVLLCRPAQINQVLMNVMVNGCHAIVAQRDVHRASGEKGYQGLLEIGLQQEGDELVIAIKDNGCGMSEETQARIFEPFFTTKEVGSGAGLGLSSAFGIIEEHKGRVVVSSRLGEGTTVTVYLPLS